MRLNLVLAVLILATFAHAKEPKHYQTGKLLKMESRLILAFLETDSTTEGKELDR